MSYSIDDTQPHAPIIDPGAESPLDNNLLNDEESTGGPGCFVWGLMGVLGVLIAIAIVVLAGTAGWTEGQRIANQHATATQARQVDEQLTRIPADIADGNQYLVNLRLNFLETTVPDMAALQSLRVTATALYESSIPTPTPEPTATEVIIVEVTPEIESPDVPATAPAEGSGFDLDALLAEARQHMSFNEYREAYELLDAITRIDSSYQRTLVRDLTHQALVSRAQLLYRTADTGDLAEAIRLTNLAENYGPIGELDYERFMAANYLDLQRTIGTGNHAQSIRILTNLINNYQATYKGVDFRQMLFSQYVSYGDAWVYGGQPCQAVSQYNAALNLFSNASVSAKRDSAQTTCEQGYQLTPGTPSDEDGTPSIAPIGEPET